MNALTLQSTADLIVLIEQLQAALQKQDAIVREQAQALKVARQEIAALKAEIADLKNGGKGRKQSIAPPPWVKPNTPQGASVNEGAQGEAAKKERKKREVNRTWKRLEPTGIEQHACEHCPDCGHKLGGGWEYSRHQVVEVPPAAIEVIDHVTLARHCGVCGKDCVPKVDISEQTLGRAHWGHRLSSLVAHLRTVGRLPMGSIAQFLEAMWGLHVSRGQISQALQRVARQGAGTYTALREQIRASSYVHADETGWREGGQNGYVWSFSTPAVRYFEYDKSRAHSVPERVLGEGFRGVLVSDFYSGYHYYPGLHQRCWVHLLRDVSELKKAYPSEGVLAWAKQLRDIYDRSKAFSSTCPKARRAARVGFCEEAVAFARPYVGTGLPQSVLSSRIVNFEAELFTFVENVEVPSENNAAERSVRPRVIARKISGGTRSALGSQTMAVLASLFDTWRLRGANGIEECRRMLIQSQRPALAPAPSNSL